MFASLLAAALMMQAAPVPSPLPLADPPVISQESRALVRCAAAFALVAQGQARGEASAQAWPDLSARGREFFVRAMAQVMDQAGLDRQGIVALADREAQDLAAGDTLSRIMPSCLLMLEASGI